MSKVSDVHVLVLGASYGALIGADGEYPPGLPALKV